jgi:hypothetical protein
MESAMSQPSVTEVYRNACAHDDTLPHSLESSDLTTGEDIITPEELAKRLKVDVGWVYEKRRPRCKNPIPAIPMGKIIRFDWERVVDWLREQAIADEKSIAQRRKMPIKARKKTI